MRSFIISLSLLCSLPAFGEASTREFLQQYEAASDDGQLYLMSFVQGVVAGYRWTNLTLKSAKQKPMFCLSSHGASQLEDPVKVLKKAVRLEPTLLDSPVGMALLVNLKQRFPCREKPTK